MAERRKEDIEDGREAGMKENEGCSSERRIHGWSREKATKYGRTKRKDEGEGRRKEERWKEETGTKE